MKPDLSLIKEITLLGTSGFAMSVTNGIVQIVCNAVLARSGGDLYVGIMTVINSVREIITMPVTGLTSGAQPVIGYNYGAGCYRRVKDAIKFMSAGCIVFSVIVWALLFFEPRFFLHLFTQETELIGQGIPAMRVYFCGIFMMALQFAGQSVFVALGKAKQAVFFSIFRKVIIVIPLTLILPNLFGLGTDGVFLAEPIFQFYRRSGQLYHDVVRCLARVEDGKSGIKKPFFTAKGGRIQRQTTCGIVWAERTMTTPTQRRSN